MSEIPDRLQIVLPDTWIGFEFDEDSNVRDLALAEIDDLGELLVSPEDALAQVVDAATRAFDDGASRFALFVTAGAVAPVALTEYREAPPELIVAAEGGAAPSSTEVVAGIQVGADRNDLVELELERIATTAVVLRESVDDVESTTFWIPTPDGADVIRLEFASTIQGSGDDLEALARSVVVDAIWAPRADEGDGLEDDEGEQPTQLPPTSAPA